MTHLRQLDPMDLVRITCGGCGRVRELPSRFMAIACGEETDVGELEPRLQCIDCKNRLNNKIDILPGQVDLQGEYFAYRDDTAINVK